MKIRITGIGDRTRNYYISRVFNISDTLEMNIAIACWKEQKPKYDKLEVVDATTGEAPIGDPFEKLSEFYAKVKVLKWSLPLSWQRINRTAV